MMLRNVTSCNQQDTKTITVTADDSNSTQQTHYVQENKFYKVNKHHCKT